MLQSVALFHRARARGRGETCSVFPGHVPGVSRKGARLVPANFALFWYSAEQRERPRIGATASKVNN
jgi:hypothetical protein